MTRRYLRGAVHLDICGKFGEAAVKRVLSWFPHEPERFERAHPLRAESAPIALPSPMPAPFPEVEPTRALVVRRHIRVAVPRDIFRELRHSEVKALLEGI